MKANGWPVQPIGEVAHCSLGKMLDKQKNQGTPRPYLRNINVRWFGFDLSDVLEMRFLDDEAEKFTAIRGDVLICEGGYPGRAAIWDGDHPIHFQKAIHRVRFHESERNKWFLYYLYFLESTGELQRHFTGSGIQHFTGQVLKRLPLPLPPMAEQRRIVGILDEAFAGIATAQANAEKNLQNAHALFESHLNAVFTQRGDGWSDTKLGDVVDLLSGFPFKSARYTNSENDVRLLRGDNIVQGALRWDDVKRWPASDTEEYERYRLCENDVVLAMDRPWVKAGLKRAQIAKEDLPCLLVQRTARLRGSQCLDNRFLAYLISSEAFIRHIVGAQTGIGVPHISGQQIKDFEFAMPLKKEQAVITDMLDQLFAETQRLESVYQRKLAALDGLKKSLLHQAFSGAL